MYDQIPELLSLQIVEDIPRQYEIKAGIFRVRQKVFKDGGVREAIFWRQVFKRIQGSIQIFNMDTAAKLCKEVNVVADRRTEVQDFVLSTATELVIKGIETQRRMYPGLFPEYWIRLGSALTF